ncbi:MAG: DUF4386 family protein [Anaerolineales bacterium]
MERGENSPSVEQSDGDIFRIGAAAAFIAAAVTLGEVIAQSISPLPGTVVEWFALFQRNRLVGLLQFWGLEVVMYVMFVIVFLAFYSALKNVDRTRMRIAVTLALIGVAVFLATNNPFAMLSLSDQHAAAATEAQKSIFVAAGQALLANTNQRTVGGFNVGLFLVSIAGWIVSASMLRSKSFSRSTAYVGIAANVLSLLDYLRQALTSSEIIALLVILPNAVLLIIWYFSIYRQLSRLGR